MTDYLNSDLLHDQNNFRVYQKTYNTISKLSTRITKMECAAFGITDEDSIRRLEDVNMNILESDVTELVNFVIENFNKNSKL